jgi:hypothetical protein
MIGQRSIGCTELGEARQIQNGAEDAVEPPREGQHSRSEVLSLLSFDHCVTLHNPDYLTSFRPKQMEKQPNLILKQPKTQNGGKGTDVSGGADLSAAKRDRRVNWSYERFRQPRLTNNCTSPKHRVEDRDALGGSSGTSTCIQGVC